MNPSYILVYHVGSGLPILTCIALLVNVFTLGIYACFPIQSLPLFCFPGDNENKEGEAVVQHLC